MVSHWNKIGYKPETDSLNDVDEQLDVEIQVGKKEKETHVISENNLTNKYRSVIVKGFTPDTPLENITAELFKNGLPASYNSQEILKNDKSGSLTLANLEPEQCLTIMELMHAKRFLGKKIYVTSVVTTYPRYCPSSSWKSGWYQNAFKQFLTPGS